jgi:hypothetical protein
VSDLRVPDGISPIVAYRNFLIHPHGPTLVSPFQRAPWPIDRPFQAACVRGSDPGHVPGEECACGIYAFRQPRDALALNLSGLEFESDGSLPILAKVALWGKVIEAMGGYRARYARIVSLAPTRWSETQAEAAAHRYGVAVSSSLIARPLGPPVLTGVHFPGASMPCPPDAIWLSARSVALPCGPYPVWLWTDPDPVINEERRRARYERALGFLAREGRAAMRLKHGLLDGTPRTIEQTAVESGLTRETVAALTRSLLARLHDEVSPEAHTDCSLLAVFESGPPPRPRGILTLEFGLENLFVFQGTQGRCPLLGCVTPQDE